MGAKKNVCVISCGIFCGIGGIAAICFAWTFLHPKKQELYNAVHDVMFIDDPMDSVEDYDSPIQETKQYESWSERDDGFDVTFSVFDVTNPAAVVAGANPIVQEIGPIYAVRFSTKLVSSANKSDWATSGIARFRQIKEYYLNNVTCDASCLARLDQTITIPSPLWAATSMWGQTALLTTGWYLGMIGQGVQLALGCSLAGAPLPPCTPTQLGIFASQFDAQLMAPTSTGGLTDTPPGPGGLGATADEAAAWRGVASNPDTMLTNIGMFLETAAGVQAGNAIPGLGLVCFVGGLPPPMGGTGIILDASRCLSTMATLLAKQTLITQLYTGAVASAPVGYGGSPMYGFPGSWSPVFAPVQVRQLLNYKTDAVDPGAPTLGLPVPALRDAPAYWSPVAAERSVDSLDWHGMQMGSQFGAQGTRYYIEFGDKYGETQDCRIDMNCWPLSPFTNSPSWNSVEADSSACTASSTCSPMQYGMYSIGNLPGRDFGTSQGFNAISAGTTYMALNNGIPLEMIVKEEKTMYVNDMGLKYWDVGVNKIPRNTKQPAQGILPGLDYMGAVSAAFVGPILGGTIPATFYAAAPMFDHSLFAAGADTEFTSYDPADTITIRACNGSAYCDDRPSDFWMFKLKVEPESGTMFDAYAPMMSCIGIFPSNGNVGGVGNDLTPNVPRAIIPVYIGTLSGGADAEQLDQLVQVQGGEELIFNLVIFLTVLGIIMILCSGGLFTKAVLMRKSPGLTSEAETTTPGTTPVDVIVK